ncbi:unnamed protein product [Phytophthora fragariaefolia]|uniref:Unnamed protein product n=1 Tax=Phytophthora fragariaefolia TaxID=1490495 RepID=A0A9W7CTE7_9STRA|nr:unnamed protein product [Phytophthora fragariaefolia]
MQNGAPDYRQSTRVPSPRGGIPRQYVGGVAQRRSRSPQHHRAASPPASDWSPSNVRRPASSQHSFTQHRSNTDNVRKQLLARRVISLDAFQDEMYKLRNGFIREDDLKRPHETVVRIPVILWPGESMAQYTQKFERWLDTRNVSLASLRDNPSRERSLWHSFAYARAGISDVSGEPQARSISRSPIHIESRSRSRSSSRSSSRTNRRSSERRQQPMSDPSTEDKPQQSQSQSAAPADRLNRGARSYSPVRPISPPRESPHLFYNKTRRQLLERRVVALDVFQTEVEKKLESGGESNIADGSVLPDIPVPLYPGESMGLYDHRFWTWLKTYDETKDSLRSSPVKERRFRIAFAYLRVNRPQTPAAHGQSVRAQAQGSSQSLENQCKISLDVLKSARARLLQNTKRHAEDINRDDNFQNSHELHEKKRARKNAEAPGHGIPSIVSIVNTSHERKVPPQTSLSRGISQVSTQAAYASSTQVTTSVATTVAPDHFDSSRRSSSAQAAPVTISSLPELPQAQAQRKQKPVLSKPPTTSTTTVSVRTVAAHSPEPKSNSATKPNSKSVAVNGTTLCSSITLASKPITSALQNAGRRGETVDLTGEPPHVVVRKSSGASVGKTLPLNGGKASETVDLSDERPRSVMRKSSGESIGRAAPPSALQNAARKGWAVNLTGVQPNSSALNQKSIGGPIGKTPPPISDSTKSIEPKRFLTRPMPSSGRVLKPAQVLAAKAVPSAPSPSIKAPATASQQLSTTRSAPTSVSKLVSLALAPSTTVPAAASLQSPIATAPLSVVRPESVAPCPPPSPINRSLQSSAATAASVLNPSPPSAPAAPTLALPATSVAVSRADSAGAVENESADTDSAESDHSDSSLAGNSEEHDGDVMNPDGCCCTKCMHNWAKTLTDRMDQLEENVMNLKREVNQAAGATVGVS